MRLIDADELIETIKGSEELLDFQKEELIACVDACDTAYDAEKVMEGIHDYFAEIVYDCGTDYIPHKLLKHHKEICNIIRKGGIDG